MANQDTDHRIEPSIAFEGISPATIAAVHHDIDTDPAYMKKIIGELARKNPKLALYILTEARFERASSPEAETAYLKGALTMVAIQNKLFQAAQLKHLFAV